MARTTRGGSSRTTLFGEEKKTRGQTGARTSSKETLYYHTYHCVPQVFESCLISKKNPRCSCATSSMFLSLGGSHSVTWPGRRPRGYRASRAGFTFSGLPTVLCVQLGENNPGSVGAGSGARVQSAFHAPAVSATPPKGSAALRRRRRS